ncbi:MAG: hypothetical protein KDA63_17585, partial [Planctomycetales bacterium]|nr:hypothetical protein [Planctomycetales bacterium]
LLGIWFWTEGTRRLVVITVAAVVSVVARESLMPFLQGERQAIDIVAGVMLGALDLREVEFWRRLRAAQWVVRWPSWRVFRPNVYVRLIVVIPAVAFLCMYVSMWISNWRHEQLIAEIKQFGGSVHAESPRDAQSWFVDGFQPLQLQNVQLGPTRWDRRAIFLDRGASAPQVIADRPDDVTSEYVDDLVRRVGESKALSALMVADPDVTNAAFSTYVGMDNLEHVELSCPRLTDDALAFLGDRPKLTWLDLTGTPVTGRIFKDGAGGAVIQRLILKNTRVDDAAVADIAKIRTLTELDLRGTRITVAAMPEIGKCLGLRSLDLSETEISDEGLPNLASLNRLILLRLNHCDVSAREVAKLADSCQLSGLALGGIDLTNDDLSGIARFKSLRYIWLRDALLGEASLSQLLSATSLHILDLSHSNVTDQHIEGLREFTEFGHFLVPATPAGGMGGGTAAAGPNGPSEWHDGTLFLKDTAITDKSLEILASMTSITQLDLTGTKITDAGLKSLARLPQLNTLVVSNTQIGDKGLQTLDKFPALQYVGIDNTNVTEAGFERLKTGRPDIQRLPPQPPDE